MSNVLHYQHRGPTTAREYHDPEETVVMQFPKKMAADTAKTATDTTTNASARSASDSTASRCFLKDRDFELWVYRGTVQRNNDKYFLEHGKLILDRLSTLHDVTNIHAYHLAGQRPTDERGEKGQGDHDLEERIAQARAIADEASDLCAAVMQKRSVAYERRKSLRTV